VREVEDDGQGVAGGQEVEGTARKERLVGIGVFSPPKGPSLYRGWGGAPYSLPKPALARAATKGGEGSGGQGWWGLAGPQTLTLAGLG
jgi:hypothetical protein